MEPEAQKAALEAIVSGLASLIVTAQRAEQPLLAFMLEQAKLEAERELQARLSSPGRLP
jgi:hypothetical protein